jgi:integral membrane protein (TIGR01906 family)
MTTERHSINFVQQALVWLVTLLVPISLVLTAVRLLMFPYFLEFEYRTPNFPADNYGFTREDRLYWSKIDLEYLLNSADIKFLGDLKFPDGAPVYNQRELKHMVDVKIALHITLQVWIVSLATLFMLGLWAWRGKWLPDYRRGLRRGGWLTVLLVGAVILFVLLGFGVFFVAFHNIFFAAGTWMFEWSDTLIRLFPERFWRDIFIYIGGLSALGGLGLALGFRRTD